MLLRTSSTVTPEDIAALTMSSCSGFHLRRPYPSETLMRTSPKSVRYVMKLDPISYLSQVCILRPMDEVWASMTVASSSASSSRQMQVRI